MLVFAEVARFGSLAGAAQALGWTQPAVAQHVRRLERDTGCTLVVRTSRGVTLTEAGHSLAAHAEAITARLRAARADLSALTDLRAGRVRLSAFPSACATFVPAAIALLWERAPGLDVRLTEAEPDEARRLLAAGDADLAVTFDYDNVPDASTQTARIKLFDDTMLLVVPPAHRLAARSDIDLAAATDQRWIAGCPRCRAHLTAAAAGCGFLPDIRHSTDDYVVTQTLVAAGLGIALLPALALEAARDPRVETVELHRHTPRRVSLTSPPDIPPSPATRALTSALVEITAPRRMRTLPG
ncbi:LysR family transcriptional regulator [Actinospica durhamensis]|uniref:LysR family transcriptional regulator n=1 Tax=Actinospica durhamensis TaxID=1508375 RepID=A0A941IRW3_9ACTN|nr:LysR family transcriptional regulator [Actinospica durhamensis]MBR7837794.1 LysR family transcriptional regulator [Actinospica durhamensis]